MLKLTVVRQSNANLHDNMKVHYSQPKGFVGRNICYSVEYAGEFYGTIVGGSATLHLIGRDEFFGLTKDNKSSSLRTIVNNIFYHVEPGGSVSTLSEISQKQFSFSLCARSLKTGKKSMGMT